MTLHRLVFDVTDSASRGAGAKVGAIFYDAVNDRMGAIDADGDILVHDTDVLAAITGGVTVTATNLDIRDLVFATDKVDVSGSSVTVTATQLDIDDLNATDDAVQAWCFDGTGNAITSTGGFLDVNVASSVNPATANTAIKVVAETVGTSLAQILDAGDLLASRKNVWLYNNSNKEMYIGPSGTTTTDGFPIFPGSLMEIALGAAVDLYAIGAAAGLNMRTLQAS